MMIVSYNIPIHSGNFMLQPMCRYVVSNGFFNKTNEELKRVGVGSLASQSCFNSYERRYSGQDLNGYRLAVYRSNGFGDHLILTALTGFLSKQFPQATINVYGADYVKEVWKNSLEAEYIPQIPSFDAVRRADYHLMLEGMFESDTEPEQGCCYDTQLSFAGFDPRFVPEEFKRPRLFLGDEDETMLTRWIEAAPYRYVLWHWAPSGSNRMYPPELAEQAIGMIAEHCDVVICGIPEKGIDNPKIDHPRVHNYMTQPTSNWRKLIPMIRKAEAVVCPDSCVLHASACFGSVPVFGLWGSFGPNDRAKYFRNHIPITSSACPFSPCRAQYGNLPRSLCETAQGYTPEEKWCSSLKGIKPETIAERVLKTI